MPTVPTVGDAASSPVALWDVLLAIPEESVFVLVSTGETIEEEENRAHVVSGPARDVALRLGSPLGTVLPAGATPIEQGAAGASVRYWPAAYVEAPSLAATDAANIATAAIAAFAALRQRGPPPYAQLDVIVARVLIGGYEYPGLVLFDSAQRAPETAQRVEADQATLEFLLAHDY
ncbi:MAG: hypothetical protein ACRDIB_07950, partial [Ardenticatenaceae bacterium]